jgi:hypothetical protein
MSRPSKKLVRWVFGEAPQPPQMMKFQNGKCALIVLPIVTDMKKDLPKMTLL